MIISSEIEKVEKVENLIKAEGRCQKSILRAFARTRAKNQTHLKPGCLAHTPGLDVLKNEGNDSTPVVSNST